MKHVEWDSFCRLSSSLFGEIIALAFFYCHCTLHSTLREEGSKIAQMNNICTDSSQDVNCTELLSNEKADEHFRKQILHLQNKLSRRLPLFTWCSRAAVSSNSFYFPSICRICLQKLIGHEKARQAISLHSHKLTFQKKPIRILNAICALLLDNTRHMIPNCHQDHYFSWKAYSWNHEPCKIMIVLF